MDIIRTGCNIEKYNGKYIFTAWQLYLDRSQDTREGLALRINLSKTGGCSFSWRGDAPSASEGQRVVRTIQATTNRPVGIRGINSRHHRQLFHSAPGHRNRKQNLEKST